MASSKPNLRLFVTLPFDYIPDPKLLANPDRTKVVYKTYNQSIKW